MFSLKTTSLLQSYMPGSYMLLIYRIVPFFVQKMTSLPGTHVRLLVVHAEVSTVATSNNDRTKIDKDKVDFQRSFLKS